MRKTKIICTLGPASDTREMIRSLIEGGMDMARFNFSHGTHESHQQTFRNLLAIRNDMGKPVGAILDSRGPEVRIGTLKGGKVTLKDNQIFTLTTKQIEGDSNIVSVTYEDLPKDLTRESVCWLTMVSLRWLLKKSKILILFAVSFQERN